MPSGVLAARRRALVDERARERDGRAALVADRDREAPAEGSCVPVAERAGPDQEVVVGRGPIERRCASTLRRRGWDAEPDARRRGDLALAQAHARAARSGSFTSASEKKAADALSAPAAGGAARVRAHVGSPAAPPRAASGTP